MPTSQVKFIVVANISPIRVQSQMVEFITTVSTDNVIFSGARSFSKNNTIAIVDVHGISWDFYTTSYYKYFFANASKNGFDFIAGETRGAFKVRTFPKTDKTYLTKGGAYEIFEDCLIDIAAWIDKAESLGYKDIYLSGYSYGPTKVAYYMSQTRDPRVKGVIFFSPSDVYGLVHEPSESERFTKMRTEAMALVKSGTPETFLTEKTWDVEVFSAQTFLSLFDNPHAHIFNYFEPSLGFNALEKLTIPVLSFTGTDDEGITSSSKIEDATNILENALVNSPQKVTYIFEDCDHSFNGFEKEMLSLIKNFLLPE